MRLQSFFTETSPPAVRHQQAVPPLTSDGLPDYAAWCADWWRGCFACSEFMPERVRFCRRWNREVYGVDVVDLSPVAMGDHPCQQSQGETPERETTA